MQCVKTYLVHRYQSTSPQSAATFLRIAEIESTSCTRLELQRHGRRISHEDNSPDREESPLQPHTTSTYLSTTMADVKTPTDPPPAYEDASPRPAPTQNNSGTRPPGPRLPLPLNLPALVALRGKRVVLASQSPRRRQLLAQVRPTHSNDKRPSHHANTSSPHRSASPTSKSSPPSTQKTSPRPSPPSNTSCKPPPPKPCPSTRARSTAHRASPP